ncbi:MAG: hypothetical protein WBM02_09745 [bacterium]
MSSLLKIPGFPSPENQDSVHFHFAPKMAYDRRVLVFIGLLFVGLMFQIIALTPWPGIPFLIIATGLMLVKGYDSRARLKKFQPDSNWTDVDMERIHQIDVIRRKNQEWNKDAIDITNLQGCSTFFLIGLGTIVLTLITYLFTRRLAVSLIIPIDVFILFVPFWFSGLRFILKQPNLAVKVKVLNDMEKSFQKVKRNTELFVPALMLVKDEKGKALPTDVKFSIRFAKVPSGFYGLQAQININLVQGSSYPYFYCIIAAKPGFGLGQYLGLIKQSKRVIAEYQEDSQAEVLVIRQFTTKESGYHTNQAACDEILKKSLDAARKILAAHAV